MWARKENDPDFVAKLAALGDIFVNDAFSVAHRAHASVEGAWPQSCHLYWPYHAEAELEALTKVLETPSRPLAAIVGGAKVSTKLDHAPQSFGPGERPHYWGRNGEHVFGRTGS